MPPNILYNKFLDNIHHICYQNSDTLIFYFQSVIFKLMHSNLNCNKDGHSKIPVFFSQNTANFLCFEIKNRTVHIKLNKDLIINAL